MGQLVSRGSGKTLVKRLKIADSFLSRLTGLQFQRSMAADAAILLTPCSSIHTCFMRFPLDVVFLDSHGAVLSVRRNLLPWRFAIGPKGTHSILETSAGSVDFQPGDVLEVCEATFSDKIPP